MLEYFAVPASNCSNICSRSMPKVSAALYRYIPCPPSSCTLAIRTALRRHVGARNPVALREHSDDFGVSVLGNLADECLAIGVGHPILGLDLLVCIHLALKACLERSGIAGGGVNALLPQRVESLCVH